MSLSIGIVGLPNVGKSTLFQAITKKQVDRANYPFCTIDPNVGVVAVPDEKLDKLAELLKAPKKIYTTVEFVDIAGLVKGAAQGEGLGNKFLANIRETDAIVYILRGFQNEKIINTLSRVDPLLEKETLETELILKDLEIVDKRIQNLESDVKGRKKEAIEEIAVLRKAQDALQKGGTLLEAQARWKEEEIKILFNYRLLTLKPRIYLLNGGREEVSAEVVEIFRKNNWPFLILDVQTELEAADFTTEERISFGLPVESGLDSLIKKSYELLDLITFFTASTPGEVRAWTVKRGATAPRAGGVIHTDFEKKFIKAEVVNWKDLLEAGGFAGAREKGLLRTEGKEYIIKDGDVIDIKHSA